MQEQITLKGITWGHSRGYTPLVACAQRYAELHPAVSITWKKRTLQEFADFPLEQLVYDYDLLIIDHPWVGCAAATKCVLPLDMHIDAAFLEDQLLHSVGGSHLSYQYDGHQWALAIDAATPVASYRKDLFEKNNRPLPSTWDELMLLAENKRVAVPGIPIDLLMNFYMFCIAAGKRPFESPDEVTDIATGQQALLWMTELWSRVDERMFACNPIAVAEMMSATNEYWYCPFAYGYSNYARRGYAAHLLYYADLVTIGAQKLSSTLGGTGLAVSAGSSHQAAAIDFSKWIASPEIQATLYTETGGQPGHRAAWEDPVVNRNTHNYFANTLPALDRAYIRPRYNGYLQFQDHAGNHIQHYLRYGGRADEVLEKINLLYRSSRSVVATPF